MTNPRRSIQPGFEVCETADNAPASRSPFILKSRARPTDRYAGITGWSEIAAGRKNRAPGIRSDRAAGLRRSIPQQTFPEPQDRARWLIPIGYVRWLPVQTPPGHFVARDDKGLGGTEKDFETIKSAGFVVTSAWWRKR